MNDFINYEFKQSVITGEFDNGLFYYQSYYHEGINKWELMTYNNDMEFTGNFFYSHGQYLDYDIALAQREYNVILQVRQIILK